jgi:dTDP-4-dehydrorhamnose 3,5-epimerase
MSVPTTEFTAHQTAIPGLIIFDVTYIGDERGYFQEKYQKAKLVAAGIPADFNIVQNNLSYNKEVGVIRGFHAEPWDKYISVVTGRVFAAFVDLRKGDSFGKVVTVEITTNTALPTWATPTSELSGQSRLIKPSCPTATKTILCSKT